MSKDSEFTFVITGKYSDAHLSMLSELKKHGTVILSTYRSNFSKIDYSLYDIVVLSSDNEIGQIGNNPWYFSNAYQSLLIHRGVNLSISEYTVRLRTDMSVSNVEYIVNKVKNGDPQKLYVSNISFSINKPYQIGDHIVAGSTDNMKKTFVEMYNSCVSGDFMYNGIDRYHSAEVNIFASFLKIKNIKVIESTDRVWMWHRYYTYGQFDFPICTERYNEILVNNFDIIDYQHLEPFVINEKPDSIEQRKKTSILPCHSSIEMYTLKNLII